MEGSAEEVRSAYDAIAAEYAATFPTTEPEAAVDLAMVEHFIGLLHEARGTHVLDAGCGTGRMARLLTDRGCTVVGANDRAAGSQPSGDIAVTRIRNECGARVESPTRAAPV